MIAPTQNYSQIFSRLVHLTALTNDGKIAAAIDSLVLNVLALDSTLTPRTAADIAEAICSFFSISLNESVIQPSVDRHLSAGRLVRNTSSRVFSLSTPARIEIEGRIADAASLEAQVRDEWLASIPGLDPACHDQLWACLRAYTAKAFHRHGAETLMLLSPDSAVNGDVSKSLSQFLTEAIADACGPACKALAGNAVHTFFKTTTPQRTKYLSQLLDGTFTFFALSIDSVTGAFLKQTLGPMTIFLDTNFIFGILGLHANPLVDVSQELLQFIQSHAFPFKIYYHEETLREIQNTINAIGARLRSREWPIALSRAAVRTGQLSGLEMRYHQQNVDTPTSPATFLTRYSNIPTLLDHHGIKIYRDSGHGPDYEERKQNLIVRYRSYLETHRPNRPPKAPMVLDHDMSVWLTIRRLRNKGTSVLDVNALLLTADYHLRRFDWQELREEGTVGSVVLPNHFLQLLRPFVPSTDDFDTRFVETFAIPEFRTVGSDYSSTVSKIMSLLALYKDMSEELAAKILANDMLISSLQGVDEDAPEFKEAIESALLDENQQLVEEKEALAKEAAASKARAEAEAAEAARAASHLQEVEAKARAAEEDAARLRQHDQDRETRTKDTEDRLNKLQAKFDATVRVLIALVFAVMGIAAILLVPYLTRWSWLANHPNRLGLYFSAIIIVIALALEIVFVDWKVRAPILLGVVAPVIFVVVQILGH